MNSVYMDAVFEQDTRKINLDMTSFEKSGTVNGYGGLAQLGERTLHRGDVAGSSPVASTFFILSMEKPPLQGISLSGG